METLKAFKTHPKAIPWKLNNHLGVDQGSQVRCKVKIDFVLIYLNIEMEPKRVFFWFHVNIVS
jgi:hypothetical protein